MVSKIPTVSVGAVNHNAAARPRVRHAAGMADDDDLYGDYAATSAFTVRDARTARGVRLATRASLGARRSARVVADRLSTGSIDPARSR
jgi:hypothetical protein